MPTHNEQNRVVETLVHPVQLQWVTARELFIKLSRPLGRDYQLPAADVRIESAASTYDAANQTVQVSLQALVGGAEGEPVPPSEALPVRLKVLLVGHFKVNEALFPPDQLEEWSAVGAPMTLYPYLREEVSALTARCGITPLVLPLLQVPTIQPTAGTSTEAAAGAGGNASGGSESLGAGAAGAAEVSNG